MYTGCASASASWVGVVALHSLVHFGAFEDGPVHAGADACVGTAALAVSEACEGGPGKADGGQCNRGKADTWPMPTLSPSAWRQGPVDWGGAQQRCERAAVPNR